MIKSCLIKSLFVLDVVSPPGVWEAINFFLWMEIFWIFHYQSFLLCENKYPDFSWMLFLAWYRREISGFWLPIWNQNISSDLFGIWWFAFDILSLLSCLLASKMTGSPSQTRPLIWINMSSSWEKICKLIFFQIPVGIWWHWASRRHYLLVLGGTASVKGSTDWYLIVLGR